MFIIFFHIQQKEKLYPDRFSGSELYDLFEKYVGVEQGDSLTNCVTRYNRVKTDFGEVTGE